MTGPEHYREAERLLADCVNESVSEEGRDHYDTADGAGGYDPSYLLAAQVHATLAQVAATIDATSWSIDDIRREDAWEQVIGKGPR
jgi:hypothetical protein